MRYYKIELQKEDGTVLRPSSLGTAPLSSHLDSGHVNPGALNIEFDIPVGIYSTASENQSYLRIWGLGLADISSAFDLNNAVIRIYGGMMKGLPLANPLQSGLIVSGQVFQAFGNWIGTSQTVDVILRPYAGSQATPGNFPLRWPTGTPLANAIKYALDVGQAGVKKVIAISPNLTLAHDEMGIYPSLDTFSAAVMRLSKTIIRNPNYTGVQIARNGDMIVVSDGTQAPTGEAKKIQFQDVIGQPTWIGPQTIQFKTVLRSDIAINDYIELPQTPVTQSAASLPVFRDTKGKLTFNGIYRVQAIHHYGNFRQADAASWNTTFDVYPSQLQG